ncbi:hypothetical protein [Corynebacterium timonense]|uniref:hypothetical protein n=1 Tax=Corynebacterium timonense TaxID=441500 RepID=UPI0012DDD0D0|nr:hypothetical protein [Corynebacterium timonense]
MIDKMIAPDVPREAAESALNAGEEDAAISSLVEDAYESGKLTRKALEFALSLDLDSGAGVLVRLIAENASKDSVA